MTSSKVVTADPSSLLILSGRQFMEVLAQNPPMALSIIQTLTRRLKDTSSRIANLIFLDTYSRVGSYLLKMVEQEGRRLADGSRALVALNFVLTSYYSVMTEEAQREKLAAKRDEANAIETLDIVISDDQGARGYEMYSGGEAFRVNFAVRIALSKLLARRGYRACQNGS